MIANKSANDQIWTLEMWDEAGCQEECEFAEQPTHAEIKQECRAIFSVGDYPCEGARIAVSYRLVDSEGDEVDWGSVTIDIEPNHELLIADETRGEGCGNDPDDHDWTTKGEGGCDSNPGVWATGGTSMTFSSRCRICGLHRTEYITGSQFNPGECDTVEYDMPYQWCKACQTEDHCENECEK